MNTVNSTYATDSASLEFIANSVTALVSGEKSNFQFILRLLNTNVDGKQKIMYALTRIKGVGRRYSNLVCKKADVDLNKRYANFEKKRRLELTDVQCRRNHIRRTRANCHNHPKPYPIQNPYMVPQQTAGYCRWKGLAGVGQRYGEQAT